MKKLVEKTISDSIKEKLSEMEYTADDIYKFQRDRILKCAFVLLFSILIGFTIYHVFILIGVLLSFYFWNDGEKMVNAWYEVHEFKKNVEFSNFKMLLIPYLLENDSSLYKSLANVRERLDSGYLQNSIQRFMFELDSQEINTAEPYMNFANAISGTNSSRMFMHLLYLYEEKSSDKKVIQDLNNRAKEELFAGVDTICRIKMKRFHTLMTKLTMIGMIPLASFAVTVGTNKLKELVELLGV